MRQKERPDGEGALQGFSSPSGQTLRDLPARVARYSEARAWALSTADFLRDLADTDARRCATEIQCCCRYLIFRHYPDLDRVRLASARTCRLPLLCPMCAIFRAMRMVRGYWARWQIIHERHPDLQLYLVTTTVVDGPDLVERWSHVRSSVRDMHRDRLEARRGRRRAVQACRADGAVWSFEIKRGQGSGLWHPHCHALWACSSAPDASRLAGDWWSVTGDSYVVDVRPVADVSGFIEVFKYALKFSTMTPADLWACYQHLRGQRLVGSFGAFRGVEIPDDVDELVPDDLPFIELLFRYAADLRSYELHQVADGVVCNDEGLI